MIGKKRCLLYIFLALLNTVFVSHAAPPHPRLLLQQFDRILGPTMDVMRGNPQQLRDPDVSKQGYDPQPDGIEYILAIRIDFSDQPGQKPASVFNNAIFGTQDTSMRLYYEEVSYGQMHIRPGYLGGVVPDGKRWYRARDTMSYYGRSANNIDTERYRQLAAEACTAADDDVDFSKYDRDGNGYVDHLIIIHSGNDESATGVPNDLWSAAVNTVPGVYDGVLIQSAIIVAEDPGSNVVNIGIYCHEFFHEFGAPDLYSWDYPVGHWCLMGTFGPRQGDGQDDGQYPSHISGYLKWDFDAVRSNGINGWLKPVDLISHETYSVDSFELPTGNRLYKIDIHSGKEKEYFLIENRNRSSGAIYDTFLPESGIVIWHIDESQPTAFGYPHRAWVEDPSDPEHSSFTRATEGAAYSADDGQTSFSSITQPDSSANDGAYSGIIISDIGYEGMSMPFTVFSGDTYEPNDSITDAYGPLTYGKQYVSFIQDNQDIDFYGFHTDADSNILICLENIPERANYDLQVFDPGERLVVTAAEPRQTPEVLSFRTRTAGMHYVAVVAQSGYNSRQPYHLTVGSTPLAPEIIAASKVYPNPGPGRDGVILFDYKLLPATDAIELTLDIYTPTGNRVYTYSSESNVDGVGQLTWEAVTDTGEKIASGVYIYVLKAKMNGDVDTKVGKIALVY